MDNLTDPELQCDGGGVGAVSRCIEQYIDAGANVNGSPWFGVEYQCGSGRAEDRVEVGYNEEQGGAILDCTRSQMVPQWKSASMIAGLFGLCTRCRTPQE